MMDLRSIARQLGGAVSGRQVIAPGPGHSRNDRSLSIRLDPNAPEGFLVHSFANDDWRECRDYVRSRLGLPSWEPGDEQRRTIPSQYIDKWDFAAVEAEANDMIRTEDDLVRIKSAQDIWEQASVKPDQRVKDYLAARALNPPEELFGPTLRYHPRCPWRSESTGAIDRIPCLLAAFRAISDDIITGIHRIRLDQPDRWPKTQRMMLGIIKHSAVKLGPVGPRLAIGEGVETCLAGMQLGIEPAWALGSVGNISFFPLIEEVKELHILCETGSASARAFKMCGVRWRRAGKKIIRVRPTIGSDLNDALMNGKKEMSI
jgi:hypothetical protein